MMIKSKAVLLNDVKEHIKDVANHHCIRIKACYVRKGADVSLESNNVFLEGHL